jgi:hypothetical protein
MPSLFVEREPQRAGDASATSRKEKDSLKYLSIHDFQLTLGLRECEYVARTARPDGEGRIIIAGDEKA